MYSTNLQVKKTYGGMEAQFHAVLTSVLGGYEWAASRSSRFTPGPRNPCTSWIRGCMGSRARLDAGSGTYPVSHLMAVFRLLSFG
jgi:hypothetical protein